MTAPPLQGAALISAGLSPAGSDPNPYQNPETGEPAALPLRVYIGVTLFLVLSAGVYWSWLVFAGINSQFPEFYPRLGSELPGPWFSTLYGDNWDWWMFVITNVNALPPMLLAMAVTHNSLREYAFAHVFVCTWTFLGNLFVIITGAIRWVGWCNVSSSAASTSCNSALWCCVYWPNAWCPNNGACTFSSGFVPTASDLHRSTEMTMTWAYAFVFFLMAVWHIKINFSLRRQWGLLK
jgi:hypothetical protein